MAVELTNSELIRELNELQDNYDNLSYDYFNLSTEYTELDAAYSDLYNSMHDELESAKEKLNDLKALQEGLLTDNPDKLWKWLCDGFGISYYDNKTLIEKLDELKNHLIQSTYNQHG